MSFSFFTSHVLTGTISRNFAIAASAFQNSNSLPIALMQSLVVTVHELKWGRGDTKDAMLGRALTYLVLYSTLGMMVRTQQRTTRSPSHRASRQYSYDGVMASISWHKLMKRHLPPTLLKLKTTRS